VEDCWCKPVWIFGKPSTDKVQTTMQIIEKIWEYNVSIFYFFICCEVVYDGIKREERNIAVEI
jgi:hypothetical protein